MFVVVRQIVCVLFDCVTWLASHSYLDVVAASVLTWQLCDMTALIAFHYRMS